MKPLEPLLPGETRSEYLDRMECAEQKEAQIKHMVDRFLAWPLPKSVCSDGCVINANCKFPRSGTNLLTAEEARQMIEHLLAPTAAENTERRLQKLRQFGFSDAADYATDSNKPRPRP